MPRSVASPTRPGIPPSDLDSAAVTDTGRPSKTRRKAAMHALQDLGEALVDLEPMRLAALGLPERLVDALQEARSTRTHEGRRRQIQYVGKLMRDIDAEPIRAALERLAQGKTSDQAEVTVAERWRDALLRDDDALPRLLEEFPDADRNAFATLVREARQERTRSGPPHRYRELFRRLKALAGTQARAAVEHRSANDPASSADAS